MEVEFYIPIVSGIPDSLSCIPDSKVQDSCFARLWIPQAKISRITESELSYMGRNNCHFGAIRYIKKNHCILPYCAVTGGDNLNQWWIGRIRRWKVNIEYEASPAVWRVHRAGNKRSNEVHTIFILNERRIENNKTSKCLNDCIQYHYIPFHSIRLYSTLFLRFLFFPFISFFFFRLSCVLTS